jgi:hypothetical protein
MKYVWLTNFEYNNLKSDITHLITKERPTLKDLHELSRMKLKEDSFEIVFEEVEENIDDVIRVRYGLKDIDTVKLYTESIKMEIVSFKDYITSS